MSDIATKIDLATVVVVNEESRTLSINRGAKHGIKPGDRFLVFGYGPEIVDPGSHENLGRIELVRGRGEVFHVQENLATMRSIERRRAKPGKRIVREESRMLGLGLGGRTVEEHIDEDQDLPFENVVVGDIAKRI